MTFFADLFEVLMILAFGISWPISIRKSWKSRTAKGKSVSFAFFIWTGYIFGLCRKMLLVTANPEQDWLFYLGWFFYAFNLITVTIDIVLYCRNVRLDKKAAKAEEKDPS